MASKGPKTGGETPAAPKPAARAKKPAAPKPMVAAAETEKPAPVAAAPTPVAPLLAEPAAAPEAAPQQVALIVSEPAKAAVPPVAAAAKAGAETHKKEATMDATVETNMNRAQNFFADINDRTKAAMERSAKIVEEMNEFAKGNLEAVVESSRITAKGFESLGQEAAEYGRKSFEQATAALKQLASVKSPTEFFKLQSDFMRQSFDSYVAEASKHTEAMMKLAGDASQPISSRIAVAAEKAKVAA